MKRAKAQVIAAGFFKGYMIGNDLDDGSATADLGNPLRVRDLERLWPRGVIEIRHRDSWKPPFDRPFDGVLGHPRAAHPLVEPELVDEHDLDVAAARVELLHALVIHRFTA